MLSSPPQPYNNYSPPIPSHHLQVTIILPLPQLDQIPKPPQQIPIIKLELLAKLEPALLKLQIIINQHPAVLNLAHLLLMAALIKQLQMEAALVNQVQMEAALVNNLTLGNQVHLLKHQIQAQLIIKIRVQI
jgi:hypothetical protein